MTGPRRSERSDAERTASSADAPSTGDANTAAPVLVAIDGPAGSGKSSVSRAAAERLGFGILDTGAAYRALAWSALRLGIDLDDEAAVLGVLGAWDYDITLRGEQRVTVRLQGSGRASAGGADAGAAGTSGAEAGGAEAGSVPADRSPDAVDVTAEIRDPAVSGQVSRVSKHPEVRERLNAMFRRIVAESGLPGVVIEGRDITTVVAPNAPVRILLTASPEVRAARRAGELPGMTREQVLADLAARDAKDTQVVDFMNPAPGVTLVDTSELDFEQSVTAVSDVVRAVQGAAAEEETR